MKFRKKPVVIEATFWDESKQTLEYLQSLGMIRASCTGHVDKPNYVGDLYVHTLEGSMRADKGDWIIKGVKGEFYPCKLDIFEATYEKVD